MDAITIWVFEKSVWGDAGGMSVPRIPVIDDQELLRRAVRPRVPTQRPAIQAEQPSGYESQRVPADNSRQRALTGHLNIYYDAVIACIGDAESILIFGPGKAKGELKKRLDKNRLGGRIAGVET